MSLRRHSHPHTHTHTPPIHPSQNFLHPDLDDDDVDPPACVPTKREEKDRPGLICTPISPQPLCPHHMHAQRKASHKESAQLSSAPTHSQTCGRQPPLITQPSTLDRPGLRRGKAAKGATTTTTDWLQTLFGLGAR